ncbi:MAG: restriction endonuclease [Clostridia bacterium]|nr:restriction endonuclease [Clostridia bacterium]
MGFLKLFFAAMAANEISDKKRAEQERAKGEQQRRDNASKIIKLSMSFYDYQAQINCNNAKFKELVSDEDIENNNVSSYDVVQTEQLFNEYKCQLKEFMSYGGNPIYIYDFDCDSNKMDFYIKIIKRLKEYEWLDKQEQYIKSANDTYWLDYDWKCDCEKRERLSVIFNAQNNEIKQVVKKGNVDFIPYYDDDLNVIRIDDAEYLDGETFNCRIAIKLTDKHILFYDYETKEELYYKSTIEDCEVEVLGSTKFFTLILNDVDVATKSNELEKVQCFYNAHNARIQNRSKQLYGNINSLTGVEFEKVCQRLLEKMGFSVETTKTTGDGGIDLIAYNSQPLLSGKYIIQCKRYTGSVGEPIIRDLYGVITSERANKGILMTSGVFTKQAQAFAEDKPIELIDGVKLKELLENYFN